MRKIKFRGKRLDGRWIYGDLWHRPYTKDWVTIVSFMEDTGGFVVIPETVGQYTGIKDKNGVEIFEGDIVKMYCSFKDIYGTSLETHEDEITIIGVVRIDMTTGMYLEVDDETENYYWHEFYRDPAEHFEIIGNIYENPELLNEEQTGGTERKERGMEK